MSQDQEFWEPIARVVFKTDSGMGERIIKFTERDRVMVCTKSRVLRLSAMRVISLDLVESFDLLEETCSTCAAGLGYPVSNSYRGSRTCRKCLDGFTEANAKKMAEEAALRDSDEERMAGILADLSPTNRAVVERIHERFCIRWNRRKKEAAS